MNTELTHDQVLEMLPAYAIGALDPEEMLAIDVYLKNHQDLLPRLRQIEAAVAQIAYTAPDAPLPVEAKERLLARVRTDQAEQSVAEVAAGPAPSSVGAIRAAEKHITTPTESVNWFDKLRQSFSFVTPWALTTSVAVIALVLLALYTSQVQSHLAQLSAQLATLQDQVNQLQTANTQLQQVNETLQQQLLANDRELQQASGQLDALQSEINGLQAANTQLQQTNEALQQQAETNQELLALIAGTDPQRVVQLPGTEESPDAVGTFFLSQDNQGVLVLRNLKPLSSEQTYQLWLIPAEGPAAPAGLLAVQPSGSTWLTVDVPLETQNFVAVGVSVEPAGGSPAPTGPIVLLGTVS